MTARGADSGAAAGASASCPALKPQGAQQKGAFTATTYTSGPPACRGGTQEQGSRQQAPRTELRSGKDERGLPVRKVDDTVEDAAGKGGPVFGAGTEDGKPDLGVTAYWHRRGLAVDVLC